MKNCTYKIAGVKGTYDIVELLNLIDEHDVSEFLDFDDIVYSQGLDRQLDVAKRLESIREKIRHEIKLSKSADVFAEDELGTQEGMSGQEFLDDPRCIIDGLPLVKKYDAELRRTVQIKNYTDKGISQEEAEAMVDKEIELGNKIREDSVTLHKIIDDINAIYKGKKEEFESRVERKIKGTSFEGKDSIISSIKRLMETFKRENLDKFANGEIKSHIGIKGFIESLDQEIFGHIDYLVIDTSGVLHIYNFKASLQPKRLWSDEKMEKYTYYMAFIKLMLRQNDIPVNGVDLNIVPMLVKYNEFNDVLDVVIGTPDNISVGKYGYVMEQYDKDAKFFIKSDPIVPNVTESDFQLVDQQAQYIVPGINIKSEGIHRSAIEFIRKAPTSGEAEPLLISRNPDGTWTVTINGKNYVTKSTRNKNFNTEILEIVKEHISELEDNNLHLVNTLKLTIQKLKSDAEKGYFVDASQLLSTTLGLRQHGAFLEDALRPYLQDYTVTRKDGKNTYTYNWRVLDDLIDYNIIVLVNNVTQQWDFITLSAYNANAKMPLKRGTNTILGMYKRDDAALNMLPGTYGSLEAIRTVLLINLLLPKKDMENLQLGNVKVLSPFGTSVEYSLSDLVRNYLPEIIKVVKDNNNDFEFNNNFLSLDADKFLDPITIVARQYALATSVMSKARVEDYGEGTFQKLFEVAELKDTALKLKALRDILSAFDRPEKYLGGLIAGLSREKIIEKARSQSDTDSANACRLYIAVSNAYHYYKGDKLVYGESLGTMSRHFSTSTNVGDANIRIVTRGLVQTFNTMATEIESYYSLNLRGFIMDYLKAKGYTLAQNATLGNINSVFEHLFELDDEGKKTMNFKNPWEDGSLNEDDRVFLKKLLYLLYLIRENQANTRGYTGYDDPKIRENLKKPEYRSYLYVPLKRASSGTRTQQNLDPETWKGRLHRMMQVLKDPEAWHDEFVEKLSKEERKLLNEDKANLTIRNPFVLGDNPRTRLQFIEDLGVDYFETNLEGILIDYLTAGIRTKKLQDFLVVTKSLLVLMQIMGENSGDSTDFEKAIKYIDEYLTVNVYDASIKTKFGQVVTGILAPARTTTTLINLGGNIISSFRDTIQGFEENYMRSLIKLNTDLSANNISAAYAYVITHGMTNSMNIDMLSKLMARYRLSNIDLASTESLKIGRAGLMNYRNWAYSTLRRPDFLNRMVLFVARCMLDGVWDGYSIVNDQLVYDWKKDKRFKALVDGTPKDSEEYKKANALYMSMVRTHNLEHPEDWIPYIPTGNDDGLRNPYSDAEIENIKALANNIYGAYDKPLKGMAEHETIMWFFGMYTTWMNGIYNNYFGRNVVLEDQQYRDETGRPMFWDYDGNMVYEDTGMPVLQKVPVIVQCIARTLSEIWNIGTTDGWRVALDWIKATPKALLNLSKLLTDMLITALTFMLVKLALDPAYKDYKKEMKDNNVFANVGIETLYKAFPKAQDSFGGVLNYVDWAFENNNSAIYDTQTRIFRDAVSFACGNKGPIEVLTNNFAVARGWKDTYKAMTKE